MYGMCTRSTVMFSLLKLPEAALQHSGDGLGVYGLDVEGTRNHRKASQSELEAVHPTNATPCRKDFAGARPNQLSGWEQANVPQSCHSKSQKTKHLIRETLQLDKPRKPSRPIRGMRRGRQAPSRASGASPPSQREPRRSSLPAMT